ncbi:MAG: Rrf2 family transcriptional regulator [Desulfuromonadaceae bacterium]
MITKKTEYALKALINLAQHPKDISILSTDLALADKLPKKFLEFLLLSLRKGGLLQSKIGKGGGYRLALDPNQISIARVVRILEGDFSPLACMSEHIPNICENDNDPTCCGIHLVMSEVKQSIASVLENRTLADLIKLGDSARCKQLNVIDYNI